MKEHQPRALIVEQSAKDSGGHYLEYAKRIAHVLSSEYDVSLLVSKQYAGSSVVVGVPIIPTFTYGYWDLPFRRSKTKHIYSRLINLWASIQTRVNVRLFFALRANEIGWIMKTLLMMAILPVALVKIIINLVRTWRLYICKVINRIRSSLKQYLTLARNLTSEPGSPNWPKRQKGRKFRSELSKYLDSQEIAPRLIFFGTITAIEMYELAQMFGYKEGGLKVLIVVRREPAEEFLSRQFWALLGTMLNCDAFQIFADTEPLAHLWEEALEIPVKVLPIPSWNAGEIETTANSDKLGLSYFGDAREEKNFSDLTSMLPIMIENDHKLFAQINYSDSKKFTVDAARNEINNRSIENVVVVDRPLTSEEYRELLFSSEIIWANYDSGNYTFRSSGILVEALMASKPVVVSDGSWMHFELYKLSLHEWKSVFSIPHRIIKYAEQPETLRNAVLRFHSLRENKMVFQFLLNSGTTFYATSWTDLNGEGYLVIPDLAESESIIKFTPKNPNIKISQVAVAYFEPKEAKYLGGVVSCKGRSSRALQEYFGKRQQYQLTSRAKIDSFKKFHSVESLRSIIFESVS